MATVHLRALHKTNSFCQIAVWISCQSRPKKNICYDLVSWIWISSILCDPDEKPLLKGKEIKGGDYLWKYGIFWPKVEEWRIQELRGCYVFVSTINAYSTIQNHAALEIQTHSSYLMQA